MATPLKISSGRITQFQAGDIDAVDGVSLNAIATTLSGTAVAVFVYDTKNDSDGGRIVRGYGLPTLMGIIATSTSITVFKGTDSTTPTVATISGLSGVTSVFALNGLLFVGSSSGVAVYNMINSFALMFTYSTSSTPALVANTVQCLTGTILPAAPINIATGLPSVTIFVGTLGGVSRIAADGTVSNWTESGSDDDVYNIGIVGDYVYWSCNNSSSQPYVQKYSIYSVLSAFTYNSGSHYSGISTHTWSSTRIVFNYGVTTTYIQDVVKEAFATNRSLFLIKPNYISFGSALYANITKDFNSGWQFGDIRGAWLANATAETLTAASLVTGDSSTFDTTVGSWVGDAGSSVAVVSGELEVTTIATYGTASLSITCVVGKSYIATCTCRRGTSNYVCLRVSGEAYNARLYSHTSNTIVSFVFVATSTNMSLVAESGSAGTIYFDNITVKLADPDVSYKNQALEVVGSITKAAVNTGCGLMSYSGFSASNYLTQAYRSDLDFGTGDFHISFWVYRTAIDATYTNIILDRGYGGNNNRIVVFYAATTDKIYFNTYDGSGTVTSVATTNNIGLSSWVKIDILRLSTGNILFYINGILDSNTAATVRNVTSSSNILAIGIRYDAGATTFFNGGKLALLHISGNAPSASQIQDAYESEKYLFVANTACTLAGTSNDCKAVDYDPSDDSYHVVSGDYYSKFKGLIRVDSASGAWTSVSAKNSLVIKGA